MKSFMLLVIMVLCTNCVVSSADWTKPKGDGYKFEVVDCGKDCMEVRTKNNTLRIYSCGKVEKLSWKELNPNEDISGLIAIGAATTDWVSTGTTSIIVGFTTREQAWGECPGDIKQVGELWVCD